MTSPSTSDLLARVLAAKPGEEGEVERIKIARDWCRLWIGRDDYPEVAYLITDALGETRAALAGPMTYDQATQITLECPRCRTYKTVERPSDIPFSVRVVEIICPDCDDGDRHIERWFSAPGVEVSQDDRIYPPLTAVRASRSLSIRSHFARHGGQGRPGTGRRGAGGGVGDAGR